MNGCTWLARRHAWLGGASAPTMKVRGGTGCPLHAVRLVHAGRRGVSTGVVVVTAEVPLRVLDAPGRRGLPAPAASGASLESTAEGWIDQYERHVPRAEAVPPHAASPQCVVARRQHQLLQLQRRHGSSLSLGHLGGDGVQCGPRGARAACSQCDAHVALHCTLSSACTYRLGFPACMQAK
jgi:hypothetical protein